MMINVQDKYIQQLERFVNSLPKDAIEIKNSLDIEIVKRVNDYKNLKSDNILFDTGLSSIREKLVSQI
ncbi:MAG: hypothetical protein QM497_00870 [Sulfurimonas sp.]